MHDKVTLASAVGNQLWQPCLKDESLGVLLHEASGGKKGRDGEA